MHLIPGENGDDFYVTVTSFINDELYKDCTNYSFFNYLWDNVELKGDWFVGLVLIDFADDFSYKRAPQNPLTIEPNLPKKVPNISIPPSTNADKKPEDFYGENNRITVEDLAVGKYLVEKRPDDTLTSFLARIKVQFTTFLKNVASFETNYFGEANKPKVSIHVFATGYKIRLPIRLSYILGYNGIALLDKGVNIAPEYVSEEHFNKTEPDDDLDFTTEQWVVQSVPLPKPQEITVRALMQDAVTALEETGHEVELPVTPENYLNVRLEFPFRQFRFKFPPAINKLLHLNEDFYFHKSTEIFLGKRDTPPAPKKSKLDLKRLELLKKSVPNLLIVETNIISNSFFGKTVRPILKIFQRKPGYRFTHFEQFNPVEYKKVCVQNLSEIGIKITTFDPQESILKEILYPTTAVLHFKKHFSF